MWKVLSQITLLNVVVTYGSTRVYSPSEIEEAFRFLRGEASVIGGSWTQLARNTALSLGKSLLLRDVELEQVYQNVLELAIALESRSGKAVPVKLRGNIGTLERVVTALRDLKRLTQDLSIEDMDDTMGCLLSLRMRWRQLLEFVDIEEVEWIRPLQRRGRKLSTRFNAVS